MRLSVLARFTLKDKPKGYLGLCGEYFNFGKDKYISLSSLILSFLKTVLDHYVWIETDADSLNSELDKIRKALNGIHIKKGLRKE